MHLQKISKESISTICKLPEECRTKFLKVALATIQPKAQDRTKVIDKVSNDYSLSKEKTYEILGIYLTIVRLFVQTNDKEFNSRLYDTGFSSDFVDSLPLISNRLEVVRTISNLKNSDYGKLESLKWRADISLSNSSLQKKVPVSVILSITLRNGKTYVIEIDGRTFHKLRYNVALLLKEFCNVKSNFISNK